MAASATRRSFRIPTTLDRLLRHWRASAHGEEPDVDALFMVSLTLTRMAEGGIYDQLGGGFCRYSVDRYWQIPHFEKDALRQRPAPRALCASRARDR